MGLLKRIERYFSAFFKLGRTARMAKAAQHGLGVLEPRLDALSEDFFHLSERAAEIGVLRDRLGDAQGALDRLAGDLAREAGSSRERHEAAEARQEESESALAGLHDRLADLSSGIAALGRAQAEAHADFAARLTAIEGSLDGAIRPGLESAQARLDRVGADSAQQARAYSDLTRRLDLIRHGAVTPPGPAPEAPEGLDALLDAFYGRLEDRYRGAREEIIGRLRVYLPDVAAAQGRAGALPVLDLGCGRGEWLQLLRAEGIEGTGIDLNPIQIAEAEGLGLDLRQGDALAFLGQAPDGAYAAITAHHLIEHIPFDRLAWLAREALRVLAPGGVLICETPNVRNLIVGATTFHIDPTHRKPLPAELLGTLMDTVGYHPVELRPLHPSGSLEGFVRANRADPHIAELLFGPQDLAVLAVRPPLGG